MLTQLRRVWSPYCESTCQIDEATDPLPVDENYSVHQKNTRPRNECEHARQWTGYK